MSANMKTTAFRKKIKTYKEIDSFNTPSLKEVHTDATRKKRLG